MPLPESSKTNLDTLTEIIDLRFQKYLSEPAPTTTPENTRGLGTQDETRMVHRNKTRLLWDDHARRFHSDPRPGKNALRKYHPGTVYPEHDERGVLCALWHYDYDVRAWQLRCLSLTLISML